MSSQGTRHQESSRYAEKRRKILLAGEELFSSHRYDEITMEAIALRAGVGKGTLYRYFPSKESLLHSILQSGHDDLVASIQSVSEGSGSFVEKLELVSHRIVESHERRHPLFHMTMGLSRRVSSRSGSGDASNRRAEFQRNIDSLLSALSSIFSSGLSEGVLREGYNARALSMCFMDLMHGWCRSRCVLGEDGLSLSGVVGLFCRGVMR